MTAFGTTAGGRKVEAFQLSAFGLSATFLNYGAILQDLRLDGLPHSLTIGSDQLSAYEGAMKYHGSIVGPVANRISGAKTNINGKIRRFDNNHVEKHTLHGGRYGVQTRIWQVTQHSTSSLTFTLDLADGDGGFPANRRIVARYQIATGPTLRLTITTETDAPSIANLTNHSYWNLDGTGHMRDHSLQINATTYLPTDDESVVTGEILQVNNTPFDFTRARPLALGEHPLDNTFCVASQRRELKDVLQLKCTTGVAMTVATTEAGVHIYDDRPTYGSIAIEAQGWPDAPNKFDFPSIEITPDAPAVQVTEWRFSR